MITRTSQLFSALKVTLTLTLRNCFGAHFPGVLPSTKAIHAGNKSWGINFCANTCGACIRTRANTGKYF